MVLELFKNKVGRFRVLKYGKKGTLAEFKTQRSSYHLLDGYTVSRIRKLKQEKDSYWYKVETIRKGNVFVFSITVKDERGKSRNIGTFSTAEEAQGKFYEEFPALKPKGCASGPCWLGIVGQKTSKGEILWDLQTYLREYGIVKGVGKRQQQRLEEAHAVEGADRTCARGGFCCSGPGTGRAA